MKSKKARGFFDEEFHREQIATKDPLTILSSKVNWEQFRSVLEKAFAEVDYSQGGRTSVRCIKSTIDSIFYISGKYRRGHSSAINVLALFLSLKVCKL